MAFLSKFADSLGLSLKSAQRPALRSTLGLLRPHWAHLKQAHELASHSAPCTGAKPPVLRSC
jgi:hypothetical protein